MRSFLNSAFITISVLLVWIFPNAIIAPDPGIVVPYYYTRNGTYTNVGCLNDPDSLNRALGSYETNAIADGKHDVQNCINRCALVGAGYAGLEFRYQCFCDTAIRFGRQFIDSATNCNLACLNNDTEQCGGNTALQVWFLFPEDNVYSISFSSSKSASSASSSSSSSRSSASSVQQASLSSARSSRSDASVAAASSRASVASSRSVASANAIVSRSSVSSSRSSASSSRSSRSSSASSSRSSSFSRRSSLSSSASSSRSRASSSRSSVSSRRSAATSSAAIARTSRSSASVVRVSSRSVATASVSSRRNSVTSSKLSAASSRSSARSSVSSSSASRISSISSRRSSASSKTSSISSRRSSVSSVRSSISSSRSSVRSSKSSTASSGSVVRNTNLKSFVYSNCYTFSSASPPLNLHPFTRGNSLEVCANKCFNHTYFGVVSGTQCYCGDSLLTSATVDGSTCYGPDTYNCPANSVELCGGDAGMPIYGLLASIGTCPAGTSIYSTPSGTTQACQTITGRRSGYTTGIF